MRMVTILCMFLWIILPARSASVQQLLGFQEPGRDIGSGSFNIVAVAEAFAEAADMLACALRQTDAHSAANSEAAAWTAVQAREDCHLPSGQT